ncbi:MAG: hypothetical protein Kow0069_06170 [Promethearchaeota archaeon]
MAVEEGKGKRGRSPPEVPLDRAKVACSFSTGGCGKCEAVLAALFAELESRGLQNLRFDANPRHGDLAFLSGCGQKALLKRVRKLLYDALPAHAKLVVLGDCGVPGRSPFERLPERAKANVALGYYEGWPWKADWIPGCPPTVDQLADYLSGRGPSPPDSKGDG